MPIYEYECDTCNHTFSLLLKMSEGAAQAVCPACGADARRKISACAVGTPTEGHSCSIGGG